MKKFIGLFLIQGLLFGGVFGQNSFKKHYAISGVYLDVETSVDNILQTSDQGYLMSGYIDDNIGNYIGFLLKVDEKGTKEWEKFYYDFGFYHVVESSDNGFIVFGSQTSWSIGSSVTKFNSQGDVLWSKVFPNVGDCISLDINQLNSDFIFSSSGALVCMDSVGNVRWAKSGSGRAASTLDGGYVFASQSGGVINFIKYNAIGDTVWTKNYNDASWTFFGLSEVQRTLDGGFIIGGIVGADGCLIRTDSLGDTKWAKKYTDPFGSFELLGIVQLEDSSVVISHGSGSAAYGAGLTAIENSGNIIWSREVQPYSTNNIEGGNVSKTTDGGLVLYFLELVYPTFYGVSLLKLNSEGLICGESPIDLPTSIVPTNLTVGVGDTLASGSISLSNYNHLVEFFFFSTISDFQVVSPPICLISVDSASTKNKVVWEKPITQAIDNFMVYREFGTGNYGVVGSVPYDSLSQFYDNTVGVNPNITSYRYKISAIDTCGNESQLSDFHETMHLSINLAPNGDINLIWDAYEGFPVTYYRILRDSTFSNNWEVLDSVSNNVFIWTDINPPTNGADYVIDVIAPFGCTSTKAQDHNSTRSNRSNILGGGVSPGANFTANFTQINTGGTIDFLDQSINNPTSWTWQFPGGSPAFSTQQNPSGIAYNTIGLYDVTLVISNAYGIDTLVKTNYIEVLSGGGGSAPACDFIASATQVPEGTPVDYLDLSLNGPTSWTWLLPGGSPAFSTVQDPVGINYNTAGTYDVTLITENVNGTDTLVKTAYIEVTSSIGVQEYNDGQVSIYPNPANDRLTVELTQIELPCFFALKDMQGRTVYSTVVNSEKLEIDLSAYAKGIYLIRVNNDNFSRELKLVKQ